LGISLNPVSSNHQHILKMVHFFKAVVSLLGVAAVNAAPQLGLDFSGLTSLSDTSSLSSISTAADEPFDANPSYTYSYQVADEEAQTYIAQTESRDNSVVTGEYSYVDPLGSLITVRYTADENGYRETREEQANFVQIRARPVVATVPAAPAVTQVVQQIKPVVQQTVASTAGKSDSDLVAKIIAQLTPFIKTTVSDSLGSGSSAGSTTTTRVTAARPTVTRVVETAPVQDAITSTFGVGGANNVRFESPDTAFAFDFDSAAAAAAAAAAA